MLINILCSVGIIWTHNLECGSGYLDINELKMWICLKNLNSFNISISTDCSTNRGSFVFGEEGWIGEIVCFGDIQNSQSVCHNSGRPILLLYSILHILLKVSPHTADLFPCSKIIILLLLQPMTMDYTCCKCKNTTKKPHNVAKYQ